MKRIFRIPPVGVLSAARYRDAGTGAGNVRVGRFGALKGAATVYARLALGSAFLSAVADRFGLWGAAGARNVAWGDFGRFLAYTAKIAPFVPHAVVPLVGWIATVLEAAFGVALLWVSALASRRSGQAHCSRYSRWG
jgi:hypothetical protein